MNKWNRKNALRMLLYAILYAAVSAVVCFTGAVHPILFVCYQITAGVLLSGIVIKGFSCIKAPGAAACFSLAMILLLVIIQDAVAWHVIPLIVIAVLAEAVRGAAKYSRTGDVIGTAVMSFSTFGYYGQIWFNRTYTYECAVEEMPAGYADGLMAVSPAWALPVVIVIGVVLSVAVSNVTARRFGLEK